MVRQTTGRLAGKVITLDTLVPALEGLRVKVVIEPLDEAEVTVAEAAQARLWAEWAATGPDGPIDDEDAQAP
jgi:ribosomal protein L12E/L44/L45/RPP1/RPP2